MKYYNVQRKITVPHLKLTIILYSTNSAAAAFGDGVYFAEHAYYARNFSKPDVNGECYMYLAKVLVGKYTKGMKGIKIPPPKDPKCHPEILFDSVVDDPDNPGIFVIFGDCDVYPEYLITFKYTNEIMSSVT